MKPPKFIFPILALAFVIAACQFDDEPNQSVKSHDLKIIGVNEVISYSIDNDENGRVLNDSSDGAEVEMITLLILDEEGNIVHEKWYHGYYDGTIPDTITIPALSEGDYQLVAATTEFYYYYYHHEDDSSSNRPLILPSWASSRHPIFVGYESFSLNEDDQVIEIDMKNVSARINFRLLDGQSIDEAHLEVGFRAENAYSYQFDSEELFILDEYSHGGAYVYADEWTRETSVYVMPQTINGFGINYYSYQGDQYYQELELAESIKLEVGDAITFTFDLDEYLEGAGSGVFNFEDIDWNDRGEIAIP